MQLSSAVVSLFVGFLFLCGLSGCSKPGEGGASTQAEVAAESSSDTRPDATKRFDRMMLQSKIGLITGSMCDKLVIEDYPQSQRVYFDNFTDMVPALMTHRADLFMDSYTTFIGIIREYKDTFVAIRSPYEEHLAVVFQKGDTGLRSRIDEILERYGREGILKEIQDRWLDPQVTTYPTLHLPKRDGNAPVLRVAVSSEHEPTFFVMNDQYAGSDWELIEKIAYDLGMRIEYSNMKFGALIPYLQAGKADVIIANVTVTEERQKSVDFSRPYLTNWVSALMLQTQAEKFGFGTNHSLAQELQTEKEEGGAPASAEENAKTFAKMMAESRIGVLVGSVQDQIIKRKYPQKSPIYLDGISDIGLSLINKKMDVFYVPYTSALGILKEKKDTFTLIKTPDEKELVGIAFKKGNENLRQQVDILLEQYEKKGLLKEIENRWTSPAYSDNLTLSIPKRDSNAPVLRVAVTAEHEPTLFVKDGQYVGLDAELMERIAYDLGMRVEYNDMRFAALIPTLQSGKADVIISDVAITEERKQAVDFSRPYFTNWVSALMLKDYAAKYWPKGIPSEHAFAAVGQTQYSSLDLLAGKEVGVLSGSTYPLLLKNRLPTAIPKYYLDVTSQIAALKSDKIAGFMIDEPIGKMILVEQPELRMIDEFFANMQFGFALPKDREKLYQQLNEFLNGLWSDGTIEKLIAKWIEGPEDQKILPDYPSTKQAGALYVVTVPNMCPFSYLKGEKYVGYEIELLGMFAQKQGYDLQLIPASFDGLIAGLSAGKYDIGAACITVTEERKQSMLFSRPNYEGGLRAVVRESFIPSNGVDNSVGFTNKSSDKKVGFLAGLKSSFHRTLVVEKRWKMILRGLGMTLLITIASAILGTLIGFGLCVVRRGKCVPAVWLVKVFIRLIQGTPQVVFLMVLYYVIFGQINISAVLVAIIGFSICMSVYFCEMLRASIDAVEPGQIEAASAMGFRKWQTFRLIVLPQAIKHVMPVYKGELISLLKCTAIVGYIAIEDLTKMSDIIRSRTYEAFFPLILITIIYLIIAYLMVWGLSRLELKFDPKQRPRKLKGVLEQ